MKLSLSLINIGIFFIGIFAPCLKVTPHIGEGGSYDFIAKIFLGDSFNPIVMSIFDTIVTLFQNQDYFIGIIIVLFTILFPVFKMFLVFEHFFLGDSNEKRIQFIAKVSKYSMIDVFVIALLLISIKALPGGSTAQIQAGCIFFFMNLIFTKFLLSATSKKSESLQEPVG